MMSPAASPLENLLNQILPGPNGTGGLQQAELVPLCRLVSKKSRRTMTQQKLSRNVN